jgi:hypothetical protein
VWIRQLTKVILHSSLMMEAVRTSETSFDNNFTRQYNPEDSSEHHTRRRENLKSHTILPHIKNSVGIWSILKNLKSPQRFNRWTSLFRQVNEIGSLGYTALLYSVDRGVPSHRPDSCFYSASSWEHRNNSHFDYFVVVLFCLLINVPDVFWVNIRLVFLQLMTC